ncbi:hypothetical protein [[Actinomadura] parvosata]|uniref:hypothetical protein n=1 Tax=[Actinomadura] parvosata TaxID=1955412 RepID=UPI001644CB32
MARAAFAARLGAAREWRAVRRLVELRAVYAGRHMERHRDEEYREWWVAVLLRAIMPELKTAGVLALVERPNDATLTTALAWQVSLLGNTSPAEET